MPKRKRHIIQEEGPHPVDVHVGERIRIRRNLVGLSQTELGVCIGVSFQQMQKYETGANRISASRLWELSRVLDAPIVWFFDGYGEKRKSSEDEVITKRETLQLVRYLTACPPAAKEHLVALINATAEVSH